eukprot:TRINITY_DN4095_c0_g1_i3.p2 TRINITY_DN4095_c0_g1~~TRINITY_DN4095_c0_g1_i3.p2  ORF type:complete len:185 (-),score=29.97 TRINITY_DN4095_c0_g1_i3:1854-2408(-)
MNLNWLYKRGSSRKQQEKSSKNANDWKSELEINKTGTQDEQQQEEDQDCLLKLRYLKTVQLMLDKKISSNLQSETETLPESGRTSKSKNLDVCDSVSKLQSAGTIGERLQSWYKSSSRSTDTSVESQEFVPMQQQESSIDHDPNESVLGIAYFLDFTKFFDQEDDQDSRCIVQQTPTSTINVKD